MEEDKAEKKKQEEQAPAKEEEMIPLVRTEIILHIYHKEIEEKEKIENFIKIVSEPMIEFLKIHIEEIKDVQGIAQLIAHPRDTLKIKENLLKEFEENVKTAQNLAGPIGNWADLIPQIVHDFLLFFHHYYLYLEPFLELPKTYPELNDIFEKTKQQFGAPIDKVIGQLVRAPVNFLKRLRALQIATEQTHADFKKIQGLIDKINVGLNKIEAATTDGFPPELDKFKLEHLDSSYQYGTMVNVKEGAKEPTIGLIISKISTNSQKNDTQIQAEMEANQVTKHRNVLKMTLFQEDELFWYLFWPNTKGHTLYDLILSGQPIIEEAARPIFRQMMHGLQHAHSCSISHNHITPKVFVFYKNTVRLTNFSHCTFVEKGNEISETSFFASPYSSPESFTGKPYDGMLSDIWSCGVILYEMLAGKPPFSAHKVEALAQKVKRGNAIFPKAFSSQVIMLLKSILCTVPSERLTIEQILSHPWMLKNEEVPISNLLSVALPK